MRIWCLTPEQSALMQFPIHGSICSSSKTSSPVAMATVAYAGTCAGKHEWCESGTDDEATGEDEVGMPTDMPR